MKTEKIRGVYPIIDVDACKKRDPVHVLSKALAAGATVVQLRAKDLPAGEFAEIAKKMAALCKESGALFIVNDRLDVAVLSGADGVHLGQDDLPLHAARKVAGDDFIIGVSTHNEQEAKEAGEGGADYIGFGAMYATGTKEGVTEPQGTANLAKIVEAVDVPVAAIGGIDMSNIAEVRDAGASAAAVISAVCGAKFAGEAASKLMGLWEHG